MPGSFPKEPYKEISTDGEDWRIIRNLHMSSFNSHRGQHSSPLPSQKPYASVSDCGLKELVQFHPLPSSSSCSFNLLPCSHLSGEKDLTTHRGAEAGSRGRHPQGNFHSILSLMISNLLWPFARLLPVSSCNYRQGVSSCAHTGVDLHAAKNLWVSDINSEERQCLYSGGFWCVEPSPEFVKENFPKIILTSLWLFDKKHITFLYKYLEQNVLFILLFLSSVKRKGYSPRKCFSSEREALASQGRIMVKEPGYECGKKPCSVCWVTTGDIFLNWVSGHLGLHLSVACSEVFPAMI